MKKMALLLSIVAFLGTVSSAVKGETDLNEIPMDKVAAIQVIAPDPSFPPEIKGLSNKWGGKWYDKIYTSSTIQSVLIVKEIKKDETGVYEIMVHYFWGKTYKSPPGDRSIVGRIEKGKLVLNMKGERSEYRLKDPSRLRGNWGTSYITMTPLE